MYPGLVTTVAKVLYCKMVDVTGFAKFHLGVKDVVELVYVHWGNADGSVSSELKDVEVVQLAEFVELLVMGEGRFI